jgi:hypothetical protein
MVFNPEFATDSEKWTLSANVYRRAKAYSGVPANCPSDYVLELGGTVTANAIGSVFPVSAGETYAASIWIATGAGTDPTNGMGMYFGITLINDTTTTVGCINGPSTANSAWTRYNAQATMPANAKNAVLVIQREATAGTAKHYATKVANRRAGNSELIVDGAIQADHLDVDSVTAGAIEAGAIGTDELAAHVVLTKNLIVADWHNLIPNPSFETGTLANWIQTGLQGTRTCRAYDYSGVPAGAPSRYVKQVEQVAGGANFVSHAIYDQTDGIGCEAGDKFYFSVYIAKDASFDGGTVALYALFHDKIWGECSGYPQAWRAAVSPTTSWVKYTGSAVAPAAAKVLHVYMWCGGGWSAGKLFFTNFVVRRANEGELIVDGAITADKINAGAVTFAKLGAGVGGMNLVRNAEMTNASMAAWTTYENGITVTYGMDLGSWHPDGGHAAYIVQYDGDSTGAAVYISHFFSVIPGERLEYYCYTGAQRCQAWIYVEFYSDESTFLSNSTAYVNDGVASGGTALSGYHKTGGFVTVPTSAKCARLILHKDATKPGQSNSYGFFTRPYVGIAGPNQTEFSAWSATGGDVTLEAVSGGLSLTGGGLTLTSGGSSVKSSNYAAPTGSAAGVGFKVSDSGLIESYGLGAVFGGTVMSSDGSYMVTIGKKLTATGLTTRYPPNNSTYFTSDGQLHVYFWDTVPATDTWRDICSIGMTNVSSDWYGIEVHSAGSMTCGITVEDPGNQLGTAGSFISSGTGSRGVYGVGDGYGGEFFGWKGAVRMMTGSDDNTPTWSANKGSLWVTSAGRLFINTNGSTTWALVGSQT